MNFDEIVTLGRTDLKVKKLGLSSGYAIPSSAVEKAYHEYGINYFHWSTRKPGMRDGLKNLAQTERDKMVVCLQSYDHLGPILSRTVEKSLKRLNMDYADVLVLGYHTKLPSRWVLNAARKLIDRGLIKHLAISGHTRSFFGKLAEMKESPIDIFMTRYNAVHKGAEEEIFPYLPPENRPGVTTYTATCWGHLLDPKKMPVGEKPLTAAECYRFVLSNPNVDLALFGPRSEEEMDMGLTALKDGPLDDEEMMRIRRIGDYLHKGKK